MNSGILAIALYLCAFALQISQVLRAQPDQQGSRQRFAQPLATMLAGCALVAHFVLSQGQLVTEKGMDFSLLPISVAIFFVVNLIVVIGSLRQPLHNLFLLLFPATVVMIAVSLLYEGEPAAYKELTPSLGIHILLSIIAYSLMSIAALEALFLAYQNRQLHQHHTSGLMRILPPLQTMENLLFSLLGAGFILLTLALITGFAFVEDFFAQHLAHKTVFSMLAWTVYGILLWGRFKLGWRGKVAILWTIGGFF